VRGGAAPLPPNPPHGRAMFTSDIHAAAPHNARMNIFVLGRAQPSQILPAGGCFLGGGRGAAAPRPYAQTLLRAGDVHLRVRHTLCIRLFVSHSLAHVPPRPGKPIPEQVKPVEGLHPPKPSHTRPIFTSDAHSRGAQRRDDHGASLGGPPPPWPSPAGGGNRAPPRREGIGETRFPRIFTSGVSINPAKGSACGQRARTGCLRSDLRGRSAADGVPDRPG